MNTYKIAINGRVQGVGFRPFIYRLAHNLNLHGTISNNEDGVLIEINCDKCQIETFIDKIQNEKPFVSIISDLRFEQVPFKSFSSFTILKSKKRTKLNLPITPDFGICRHCKADIDNVLNRRYLYPFTSCTECGPRYSICTDYPFDRESTNLTNFKMCPECLTEYTDPYNRRFHSQTNSCSTCGIIFTLYDTEGNQKQSALEDTLATTAEKIKNGNILAIKNSSGFLICCDAYNKEAISKLRRIKNRPKKPFAILYHSIEHVKSDFKISEKEEKSLQSYITPIVLLKNCQNINLRHQEIAPNLGHLGVMLPSSGLLHILTKIIKNPIIATSANISGSPILFDKEDIKSSIHKIDYLLDHNLGINFPQDDSVVRFVDNRSILLRRSRGYAPSHSSFKNENDYKILAMGAHLKSTFTIMPYQQIYCSQYFGNLDNYQVFLRYQNSIHKFSEIFNFKPSHILTDSNTAYQSSTFGLELAEHYRVPLIQIQHHKAHFAAVLGENNLWNEEKVLGIIWDGNGMGLDKNIWGGEFFKYENRNITRVNHFEYFDWLANDNMSKYPILSLFSLSNSEQRLAHKFSHGTKWTFYHKLLNNNKLKTSSCGRLIDATASLVGLSDTNSYEAESALLLEDLASQYQGDKKTNLLEGKTYSTIPSYFIIQSMYNSLEKGVSKVKIAADFFYTLACTIVKEANKHNLNKVACSGGVFQNEVLLKNLSSLCQINDLDLYLHKNLSPNDENISYGQLMYFLHIKN